MSPCRRPRAALLGLTAGALAAGLAVAVPAAGLAVAAPAAGPAVAAPAVRDVEGYGTPAADVRGGAAATNTSSVARSGSGTGSDSRSCTTGAPTPAAAPAPAEPGAPTPDLACDATVQQLGAVSGTTGTSPGAGTSVTGVQVTVTGTGFEPGERVTASLPSRNRGQLGSAVADAEGTVSITATVPALLPAGDQEVLLRGTSGGTASTSLVLRGLVEELRDRVLGWRNGR